MNDNCPTCGQPWPDKAGRWCSVCGLRIGRHDKYRCVGSKLQHRDCANPRLWNPPATTTPTQTAFLGPEEPAEAPEAHAVLTGT